MARTLLLHGDVPEPAARPRFALTAKGFRPFFLLASGFAALTVTTWVLMFAGVMRPATYLAPFDWHAHEMVFGFTTAVIAGFLLTAVGNWTHRETAIGRPLLALAGVWVAGRVAMAFPTILSPGLTAAIDLAFLPLLLVAIGRPLVASGNRRNFIMLGMVLALFGANLTIHLDALGVIAPGAARRASFVAIDVVLLMILVIAGRVFPMFTRNATQVSTIRSIPRLDVAAAVGMLGVTLLDAVAADPQLIGAASGAVAIVAAARAYHWGTQHTAKHPLLWVLHAGYAWLVLGLLLRAAATWTSAVPTAAATHALTVGAIGTLTLGMMARVSLGHTGRALVAPAAMTWAFVAINLAAAVRVAVPIVAPGAYLAGLMVSGALWATAFAIYLLAYAPMLITPRVDGKAG